MSSYHQEQAKRLKNLEQQNEKLQEQLKQTMTELTQFRTLHDKTTHDYTIALKNLKNVKRESTVQNKEIDKLKKDLDKSIVEKSRMINMKNQVERAKNESENAKNEMKKLKQKCSIYEQSLIEKENQLKYQKIVKCEPEVVVQNTGIEIDNFKELLKIKLDDIKFEMEKLGIESIKDQKTNKFIKALEKHDLIAARIYADNLKDTLLTKNLYSCYKKDNPDEGSIMADICYIIKLLLSYNGLDQITPKPKRVQSTSTSKIDQIEIDKILKENEQATNTAVVPIVVPLLPEPEPDSVQIEPEVSLTTVVRSKRQRKRNKQKISESKTTKQVDKNNHTNTNNTIQNIMNNFVHTADRDDECPICFYAYSNKVKRHSFTCKHAVCTDCFGLLKEKNPGKIPCPLCRDQSLCETDFPSLGSKTGTR